MCCFLDVNAKWNTWVQNERHSRTFPDEIHLIIIKPKSVWTLGILNLPRCIIMYIFVDIKKKSPVLRLVSASCSVRCHLPCWTWTCSCALFGNRECQTIIYNTVSSHPVMRYEGCARHHCVLWHCRVWAVPLRSFINELGKCCPACPTLACTAKWNRFHPLSATWREREHAVVS